jgi:hypothetical protein
MRGTYLGRCRVVGGGSRLKRGELAALEKPADEVVFVWFRLVFSDRALVQ